MIFAQDKIQVSFNTDERGKISCGAKGKLKSLDYFRVDDFEEITRYYGLKPNRLFVYFPSNNEDDFIIYRGAIWGKNKKKKCVCDGYNFKVIYDQELMGEYREEGKEYKCTYPDCECKIDLYFSCWVANPQTAQIVTYDLILFSSHSKGNADRLITEIQKTKALYGTILTVPFELTVKIIGDGIKRYPIIKFRALPIRNQNLITDSGGFGSLIPIESNKDKAVPLLLSDGEGINGNGNKSSEQEDIKALEEDIKVPFPDVQDGPVKKVEKQLNDVEDMNDWRDLVKWVSNNINNATEKDKLQINKLLSDKKNGIETTLESIIDQEPPPEEPLPEEVQAEVIPGELLSDRIKRKKRESNNEINLCDECGKRIENCECKKEKSK